MKRKIILLVTLLLLSYDYSNAQYGPVVSFTYDDGSDTWLALFDVFQEYGFPGVVYINGYLAWVSENVSKLLEMQAAGWEISNHTFSHPCPQFFESGVDSMKDWLDANGFPNSGFGAPCNAWNHTEVNFVKKYHPYYLTATELPGMSQPFDPYYLQRINLTNQDNIVDIRAILDDVVANHKWVVFIAHKFEGNYGDPEDAWSQSDSLLRMVFDEIVLRGIPVKTVREVMNDLYPPGCVIECAEDTMQLPVLTYIEQQELGEPVPLNTSVWNEYWHNTSWTGPLYMGSPVVYCHTSNDTLPVMKFYRNVPNGEYEVVATIIEYDPGRTYRLYYSFDQGNPSQFNVDIINQNSDVSLGTVTITNGQFSLYTQNADAISGGDGFVGWAFIRLIAKPLLVNLKVFLEGPYNGSSAMTTTLNSQGLIPKYQPFKKSPWNYLGTEAKATFLANVVDWVMIELRNDSATIVSRRAGLLLSDGSVVDIDGSGPVKFKGISDGNYYIVVRHRNHLAIMTASAISLSSSSSALYDFTTSQSQAYGTNAMKDLGAGVFGMISGDGNGNGGVNIVDRNLVWRIQNGTIGYLSGDFNLSTGVNIVDRNLEWRVNNGKLSQVPN